MIRKLEEGIYPSDIKKMDIRQLELLSYEIRDMLISTVSDTGGHLASNLGVVELTIALHKVFDARGTELSGMSDTSLMYTSFSQAEGLLLKASGSWGE